jgi:two-component system, OmpR family, response regulator
MLFLSWKVTFLPDPRCVQPSGYLMAYPAARLRNVRNTWLSGMSPVAADLASADSAPGEEALRAWPPDPDEPPQAASPRPAAQSTSTTLVRGRNRVIAAWWPGASDNLLKAARSAPPRRDTYLMLPRLLVVEDDAALRGVLGRGLREEGFEIATVGTGRELLERAVEDPPDALVVDIGLPDADGRDVCQALRTQGINAPVLFLTARDALTDRLAGFHAGGDDYVTKPFDLEEVVVRLRALLRRTGVDGRTELAGLRLDPADHTAARSGAAVSLTPTEFRLLAALAGHGGKAVRRLELVRTAWPHGAIVHDNTLDVYVARLRRKLRRLPEAPRISTVHGVGYRLE